jgi:hypothetical protein
MRLAMVVNDSNPVVASLPAAGYLSAHVNLSDRPQENKRENSATIAGFETRDSETVHLQWPSVNLKIGDVVELRVLPDGEGDDPSEIRKSSESPDNLFTRAELANELVQAVSEFEQRLREISAKSKELEPPEEHKKFMRASGRVTWELGQILLSPAYRRHKELIPHELRGELL